MPRSSKRITRTSSDETVDAKLLHLLRRRGKKGVRVDSIVRAARLNPTEASALLNRLVDLQRRGAILRSRDGSRISLAATSNFVSGTLRIHPDGYAFLSTDPAKDDYFVPRRYVSPAMDGDRVLARLGRRSKSREAHVVDVVERAVDDVLGIYRRADGVLEPRENNVPYRIRVATSRVSQARDGELVVGRILSFPTRQRSLIEVEITAVLGPAGDPQVETAAIVRKYHLPTIFPPEVLAEATSVAKPIEAAEVLERADLQGLPFVTIDGENARDFDDAVALESRTQGVRLWVAIADVAHYVPIDSPLDREAARRGTSVYFPDRVLPMLPEALSNEICSLRPGERRLTLSVVLDYDREGLLESTDFKLAVIRSRARLTYGDVKQLLLERNDAALQRHADHVPMLDRMERLCRQLMEQRRLRGSIDFDLPEAEIVLDLTGRTENIVRAERHVGHQIIEEFMIAANTAVARKLQQHGVPSLHRIHEPPDPDRITELSRLLTSLGLPSLPAEPAPADIQQIVAAVEDRPEKRLVNTVLLRSMRQARYATDALGHFGLATRSYTHFTSPIRRYPDLIVHRLMRELLLRGDLTAQWRDYWSVRLARIAEHSSWRERVALEAERECIDLKKAEFMHDKIGVEFDAHISGVQSYGVFVELVDWFVEGLVHIGRIEDDQYGHDERAHLLRGRSTGRILRLGDPMRVRLVGVDLDHRRIDFVPVAGETSDSPLRHTMRKGSRPSTKARKHRKQRP
jgi:ribonuclease R